MSRLGQSMWRALAVAWCLTASALAFAAQGSSVSAAPGDSAASVTLGAGGEWPLSRAFLWLEDPTTQLALEQVLQPANQARFKPVAASGAGSNFGLTSAAIWLRLDLRTPQGVAHDWLLEVAYPPLDHLELHVPDGQGGYSRQTAGDTVPFSQRVVPHRNHVLRVNLPPGSEHTLYLRVRSEGPVSVPARLWRPEALWAADQATFAALSLYFGLLLGLLLYNLLLFVTVRDLAFLYYVGFVAAMGVAQAALTGLGTRFIWPEWTWWTNASPNIGNSASAVFGILFARTFLASRQQMPKIDWIARWLMWGWIANLAASLVLPYVVSTWLSTVLAPFSVAALVMAGVQGVRIDYPGARYFLGAWAMLLLGVTGLLLHNTGLIPSNLFTANFLLMGSALEMVLLSFALGDRINQMRREKEQAQARIATEHALLQERDIILENSLVGIAFLTPTGRFKWANAAMRQIFAVDAQASDFDSMEPYYMSRSQYLEVGAAVAASIGRGEVFQREIQMRRADGQLIWAALSGKAVSQRDMSRGTVWGIVDITQRKLLEEELQRTSSEREAILNSALVGIVLSVARRLDWVNERFASMLGYGRHELLGQPSTALHTSPEAYEAFGQEVRGALQASGSYTCERQLRRRDGSLLWVEMAGNCIQAYDPDSGVIWTFLDITERKQSELEIREALEQQKALNELRSRFVAMTSHEFRTPLAAILSAGELLRDYGDRLPPEERVELLDSISAAVQRMSRMMDRVLLLGKADAQMLDFEPQELDLVPLCRKFIDEARAQHPDAPCEVATRFDPALRRGLYDEKLLRHIFGNLLSNALKYSPQGGTVEFRLDAEGSGTRFEVRDQGIGIPAEELTHLFESFHRASNVGGIQGTGLGLAIVRNAVQMHGGRIAVASTPGVGSCFTVWLPGNRKAL
jgi:PAS domain S-box-containing protein